MKKTSIRTRLMIMVIFLATLPVVLSTIVAINNIRNFSERELIDANFVRVEWGASYLEGLISQMDKMFYSLQINNEFVDNMFRINDANTTVQYQSQKYLRDMLSMNYYANSDIIDQLSLYIDDEKTSFTVSYYISGDLNKSEELTGYWSRLNTAKTNIYFELTPDGIFAVHSFNRFSDQKMYGGLATKVRKNVLEEAVDILHDSNGEDVFIVNDKMDVLFASTDSIEIERISSMIENQDKLSACVLLKKSDYYFFIEEVDGGKLYLVKAIPTSIVRAGEIQTIQAGAMIAALFVVIAAILSVVFSIRISKPIINLAKTMNSSDLKGLKVGKDQSIDEIDLLEKGYKQMVERLKELVEEEYQHEIELKNAQLHALQAQINPHFLNNSLNLIGGMALEKQAPEIYEVSRSISDLLRYSLTDSDVPVNLEDELTHTKNYLRIQEKRFEDRCLVRLEIDKGLEQIKIPKFIIQPMIENAFEHGLQPKRGQWELHIRVRKFKDRLGIIIKDNGVGIKEDRLKELRQLIKNPEHSMQENKTVSKSIGIKNVALRLKLRYSKKSRLRLFSKENFGTMIVLTIELNEWEI